MDDLKEMAARAAVEQVRSGMIIGLGTGSTAFFALKTISQRLKRGEIEEAYNYLRKAFEKNPDEPVIREHLKQVLERR